MTNPISRRQTLQALIKHVLFLLTIPLTSFLSSCLNSSFMRATVKRPNGENMNQASSPGTLDPYRLPRHVVPIRYDLRLEPDLPASSFAGQEVITLKVHQPTSEIVLNAIELDITSAKIEGDSGPARQATITLDAALQRCYLIFTKPLSPGTWKLTMTFCGTLNDKLRGFYRSTYKDERGTIHNMAATQFEATDARRAFPCWDEPDFKAVFATTLVVDPMLITVSNSAIAAETLVGGKKVVRFADTMKMSTYLVAFIVGQIEPTEPVMIGKTPLRLWAIPGKNIWPNLVKTLQRRHFHFLNAIMGFPTQATSSTCSPFPTLPQGPWKILGPLPTVKRPCWSIGRAPRTENWSAWPMWSRMKTRTCGSAIW